MTQDLDAVQLLLSLQGSIDDDEEAEIRARIAEAKTAWRSASCS